MSDLIKYLTEGASGPLLYHYGREPYREILSLRQQAERGITNLSKKDLDDIGKKSKFKALPGSSADYVCFFFEPVPLDLIGGQYPDRHKAWAPGTVLYEMTVDPDSLPPDVMFYVTESSIGNTIASLFWPGDNASDTAKRIFFAARSAILGLTGNAGSGRGPLKTAMLKQEGLARAAYRELLNSMEGPDDYRWDMYAPGVPHVMVWTSNPIPVTSSRRLTVPDRKIGEKE
jgi:hypothetical protein